jgi:hypothetical protein
MTLIKIFNTIQRSISFRKCIDCNYYYIPKTKRDTSIYMISKCMKFLSPKTDARGSEFEYAYIVRSEKSMCGPDGMHFVKKPRPPRTLN